MFSGEIRRAYYSKDLTVYRIRFLSTAYSSGQIDSSIERERSRITGSGTGTGTGGNELKAVLSIRESVVLETPRLDKGLDLIKKR